MVSIKDFGLTSEANSTSSDEDFSCDKKLSIQIEY